MRKFRAFVFHNRLTFWLTYAGINLVLLAGLHLLFRIKDDWVYTVGFALLTPIFYLMIQGRHWK